MKRKLYAILGVFVLSTLVLWAILPSCKKDESEEPASNVKTYQYDSKRSYCDPLILSVKENQTLTITTKDSVITNPTGGVADCDFWTDADGIPDCHYVDQIEELHGLPFMALIGKFGDEYFLVGTYYKHTFTSAGNLELSVNDFGICGDDADNVGTFVITVKTE